MFGFEFRLVYFRHFRRQYVTIGSADGLAPNRHKISLNQARTGTKQVWTKDDSTHWLIYTSSGHIELNFVDVGSFGHAPCYNTANQNIHVSFQKARCFQNIWPRPWFKVANQNMSVTTFVTTLIGRLSCSYVTLVALKSICCTCTCMGAAASQGFYIWITQRAVNLFKGTITLRYWRCRYRMTTPVAPLTNMN